jgi:hypothetical protein
LVNCGLHDIKLDKSTGELAVGLEDYRANLHAIVALAPRLADALVWIRTTPVDDERHAARGCGFDRYQKDVATYNTIADEVMREWAIPAIDLVGFTDSLGTADEVFRDGVHFQKWVSQAQGHYIAGWVLGWLARNAGRGDALWGQ